MPYLCIKCLNYIEHKVEEVQFHLFRNRIDISYTKWNKHREKDEPSISSLRPVNATTEFVDDTDFASDIPTDGPTTLEMVNATKDNSDEDDLVKFQELLLDAEKPLYEGCLDFTNSHQVTLSSLSLSRHRPTTSVTTTFIDYAVHNLRKMGNINPRDSQAWRTIDEKFPKIAEDPRNLRLGISNDRVDVDTGNRHHSVWPVLTVIYNLPPWLCIKRKFIMLSVLISGYPGNDIDTINDYPVLGTSCGYPYSGFKEKNVAESLVETLLNVPRKIKDRVNARLDLAELGVKPKLFTMQEEYKTTLPQAGYTLTNAEKDIFCEMLYNIRVPQGYCSNFSSLETITEETIEFFSEYHKSMETIGIPPDKHETGENKEGKPLSDGKLSEVSMEFFQKAHLYVIHNTNELV
nr:hypothetical protein [Tanacetum cinerariifolium]